MASYGKRPVHVAGTAWIVSEGRVVPQLEACPCDQRADEGLVLEVWDEGPGVPAEEADRIFERFHRIDRSRARSQGGVGLGLAIVRSVVEAHGGAMWATPNAPYGAMFHFSLPVDRGGD